MADKRRAHRIAEKIREVVATLVLHSADERLGLVTITAVTVSSDLRHAKVYWNITGDEQKRKDAEAAFKKAAGYYRKELGKTLTIKFLPELKFFYDDTLDTMDEVSRLMQKAGL